MRPLDWIGACRDASFNRTLRNVERAREPEPERIFIGKQIDEMVYGGTIDHGNPGERNYVYSTPGQAYVDGMRFVQFYFGLPLAMIILSITVVPIYHRLGVYTAYEYIEKRFDAKTRVLHHNYLPRIRGLAAGITSMRLPCCSPSY